MTATVLLSISLLGLAACGPHITDANINVVNKQREALERIGKGISPKEVESILGPPSRTETKKLSLETQKKEVDLVRYYYQQDGDTIELHFVDNKLISDVPPLAKPATPAPKLPAAK